MAEVDVGRSASALAATRVCRSREIVKVGRACVSEQVSSLRFHCRVRRGCRLAHWHEQRRFLDGDRFRPSFCEKKASQRSTHVVEESRLKPVKPQSVNRRGSWSL